MPAFSDLMQSLNGIVWGPVMIALLVGTGLYLTIRLVFVQIRLFGHSVRCVAGKYDDPGHQGEVSHFQALSAALSATIGTGNIVGVATAIALGGPGAVFWMWTTALVGMATKFASCSLAVRYRIFEADGRTAGGPMYFLANGLHKPWLGFLFALFAAFASLGIGCAVQSNSLADGLLRILPASAAVASFPATIPILGGVIVAKFAIGIVFAVLVGAVIIGGITRIARVSATLVPVMCVFYVTGALIILAMNASALPGALAQIFRYAFTPVATGAGFIGVVVQRTVQKGVARGVFSNESGLGSAPMAHAAAKTNEMVREGLVAMLGPFIDTIVVCTMTALVIVVTGAWQVRTDDGELLYGPGGKGLPVLVDGVRVVGDAATGEPFTDAKGVHYAVPTGADLTISAFERVLGPFGRWIVAIGIVLFAYSTMIAWSYYGERCWFYLLGDRATTPYRIVFCIFIVVGTISGLDVVWLVADNLNALMAIPNLIGIIGLSGLVARETRDYVRRIGERGQL